MGVKLKKEPAELIMVGDKDVKPVATLEIDGETVHLWKVDTVYKAGIERDGAIVVDDLRNAVPKEINSVDMRYVGLRDMQKDPSFGTGYWRKGQIKTVPYLTAMSLIREFPGAYVKADDGKKEPEQPKPEAITEEEQEKEKAEEQEKEDNLQAARDLIATMSDVAEIRKFAEVNFGQKLHHSITTVETAKQKVLVLLEQFGMP